jgi:hypothetical protein
VVAVVLHMLRRQSIRLAGTRPFLHRSAPGSSARGFARGHASGAAPG